MGEVVVIATAKVKEGEEGRMREVLSQLAAASHEEEGCITYALHVAKDDPCRFVLVERWISQEALEEHFTLPHVRLVADSADALEGQPQVFFCEAVPAGSEAKGKL